MLLLAKAQGEDLLQLKEHTPHGEFKTRIKTETRFVFPRSESFSIGRRDT